jgi:MoxR-like ATPase
LSLAARAYAFLQGRAYVTPQDVKTIAPAVLRHRGYLLTYRRIFAEAMKRHRFRRPDQIASVNARIFDSVEHKNVWMVLPSAITFINWVGMRYTGA